jgi:hypothetical protein
VERFEVAFNPKHNIDQELALDAMTLQHLKKGSERFSPRSMTSSQFRLADTRALRLVSDIVDGSTEVVEVQRVSPPICRKASQGEREIRLSCACPRSQLQRGRIHSLRSELMRPFRS